MIGNYITLQQLLQKFYGKNSHDKNKYIITTRPIQLLSNTNHIFPLFLYKNTIRTLKGALASHRLWLLVVNCQRDAGAPKDKFHAISKL